MLTSLNPHISLWASKNSQEQKKKKKPEKQIWCPYTFKKHNLELCLQLTGGTTCPNSNCKLKWNTKENVLNTQFDTLGTQSLTLFWNAMIQHCDGEKPHRSCEVAHYPGYHLILTCTHVLPPVLEHLETHLMHPLQGTAPLVAPPKDSDSSRAAGSVALNLVFAGGATPLPVCSVPGQLRAPSCSAAPAAPVSPGAAPSDPGVPP